MILESNTKYQAKVTLGFLTSMADNETIANKFREAGFKDVTVTGTGKERTAVGEWPGATKEVDEILKKYSMLSNIVKV